MKCPTCVVQFNTDVNIEISSHRILYNNFQSKTLEFSNAWSAVALLNCSLYPT